MSTILFVGAGAIGRGYMPWIFKPGAYDLVFVDSNKAVIEAMKARKHTTTWRAKVGKLEKLVAPVKEALLPHELDVSRYQDLAAVFVSVGPRNCVKASQALKGLTCPIILNENDSSLVDDVRAALGQDNVYFAVPDVITSNTAPAELRAEDPNTVITEDGVLFVDDRANVPALSGDIHYLSEKELLYKQWTAKLYIHNTPHCVAAYLGALVGKTYLHEGMAVPQVDKIVEGVMKEMLTSLKLTWEIPHEFLDWYAQKELSRFRNQLLFDPITRVAREPLRKLEPNGRLIGAANICLAQGFVPSNLLKGIIGALLFREESDSDKHLKFMFEHMDSQTLLIDVLRLRPGEALEIILSQRLEKIMKELLALKDEVVGKGAGHV